MTRFVRTSLCVFLLVSPLGVSTAFAQTTPAAPYPPLQYGQPQYGQPQDGQPQYAPPPYFPQQPLTATVPAQPPVNHWDGGIALEGVVAAAGPYGVLGIALDYSPTPWFVLNAGVGLSKQAGLMPRFRVPLSDRVGLGVELGLSAGPYVEWCVACDDAEKSRNPKWDTAFWFNSGAVIDVRAPGGFHFRGFIGREFLLNPDDCYTDGGSECGLDSKGYAVPYLGAAFGGVLGI